MGCVGIIMSETMRMWTEASFNVAYLIVVWGLVAVMIGQRSSVAPGDRRVARLVRWAFALLALGDTGHVGFRVLAYAREAAGAAPAQVLLNFTDEERVVAAAGTVAASTRMDRSGERSGGRITLRPREGVVLLGPEG